MGTMKEVLSNKRLVLNLAVNDFINKYAGSYFGIVWAFIQPTVTVMIYMFVFQIGFKAAPVSGGYPYVLWLIAGIVPWFFFAEGVVNATSCFIEYSYLVKKVVFHISVLPLVKVLSSLFIHLFFVGFAWLVFVCMGHFPGIHMIQLIYYIVCLMCLVISLAYFTSSVTPFFKDFSQIVNILTQIGMWLTPIMWNYTTMDLGPVLAVFKLNPMFYIVQGYRDCFIDKIWFWQRPTMTFSFWITVFLLFFIGEKSFKTLKDHFADVL
jgi:teichoic acid transport system permease protein